MADDNPALVNRAIELLRTSSGDDPARRASDLGAALTVRFDLTGDTESLREAVAEHRTAVAGRDDPRLCSNLGIALLRWYECTDELGVLTEACDELRRAVELVQADDRRRASYLANHGLALVRLAERTGVAVPALEAVAVHGEAVAAAGEPALKAAMLANRAAAMMLVFRLTGDRQQLRAAVGVYHEAVRTVPSGHAYERGCLAGLGEALATAATLNADVAASVEAVTTLQTAVHRLRASDPDAPLFLSCLAEALRCSYAVTGDTQALHDSVAVRRAVLARTPPSHPLRLGYLANLAMSLRNRFEALHDTADLHEAGDLLAEVLSAATDQHVGLEKWWGDRAHVLHRLGAIERDPAALAEAAALLRAAVEATGPQERDGVMHRINLTGVLVATAELRWDEALYEGALAAVAEALPVCAEGTPAWAELHQNLGLAHAARCRNAWSRRAYEEGTAALWQALHTATASPKVRMAAGWQLARLHELGGNAAAALEGYTAALELLDLVAWRGLRREDQERALTEYGGLGRAAAACAITLDDADRAITLLEQGRGVLLGRIREDRSRHTRLEEREPALARELRDALDAMAAAPAGLSMAERQRLALRRTAVLDRIRSRPGFTDFLLPPDADRLRRSVRDNAVVALNVAPARCDALISVAGRTSIVPLPKLTADDCASRLRHFLAAVTANTWETNGVVSATLGWLWDVAVGPVIAALGPRDETPHVWWMPTGPLSLLPLHAAGHHSAGDGRSALDRVVSSYLPAMRPLTDDEAAPRRDPAVLVVGADTAAMPLPDVAREVTGAAAQAAYPVTSLVGAAATKAAVLAELPAATRLHVAGHAVTDLLRPSESHLVLADDVLRVREISAIRTVRGDLAYLSACESAAGSPGLADEAIHISSAFQIAGFRDVIGTLWRVPDRAARQISTAFYTAHASQPVHQALNVATRQHCQRYPANPYEWAAFVHCGSLSR